MAANKEFDDAGHTVKADSLAGVLPADDSEIADSIEIARQEIEKFRQATGSHGSPSQTMMTDKFAFAFDIDGVLIRGGKAIPEAIDAIKVLNGENKYGIKMYVLLLLFHGCIDSDPEPTLHICNQRRWKDRTREMYPVE